MPIHKVTTHGRTGYKFGKSGKTYYGKFGKDKAKKQMRAMFANGYHESILNKFNNEVNIILDDIDSSRVSVDEFEIDPDVFFFIENKRNKKKIEKFEAILQNELDKVKAKAPELNDIYLNFDNGYLPFDGEMIVAFANPLFENEIAINMTPFVNAIADGKTVEEAAEIYKYTPDGEHILQHECAHWLDIFRNGDKDATDEHDDEFIAIQKELDSIKPKLDRI